MMQSNGHPPKTGWAHLVCELLVSDLQASLDFWQRGLGFETAYQRPEQGFAYLERPEGGQIMLCQNEGQWERYYGREAASKSFFTPPFAPGVMFQISVASLDPVLKALAALEWPLLQGPEEVWRRWGDREGGRREIRLRDPDGYFVMLAEDLGERSLT